MRKKLPCLILMLAALSCSRLILKRPPANITQESAAQEWVKCTDVQFAPVVDAAFVAAAISFLAFSAVQEDELALIIGGVFFTPLGVAAGISSVRGAGAVSECKKLHNLYEQTPASAPTSNPANAAIR